jgi:hypothetical protein
MVAKPVASEHLADLFCNSKKFTGFLFFGYPFILTYVDPLPVTLC